MRQLLIKLGKDFGSDMWGILLANEHFTFSIPCQEGFEQTMPYPGGVLGEDGVRQLITFLEQTLLEKERDNEQRNLE